MKLYVILSILTLSAAVIIIACTPKKADGTKEYKSYYVLGTKVDCAEAQYQPCGYKLSDCTIPYEFKCVVNLVEIK